MTLGQSPILSAPCSARPQERAGLPLLSLSPLCPLPRAPMQRTPGGQGVQEVDQEARVGPLRGEDCLTPPPNTWLCALCWGVPWAEEAGQSLSVIWKRGADRGPGLLGEILGPMKSGRSHQGGWPGRGGRRADRLRICRGPSCAQDRGGWCWVSPHRPPRVCAHAREPAGGSLRGTGAPGGTAVVTEGLGLDPAATVCQPCDLVQDVSHR